MVNIVSRDRCSAGLENMCCILSPLKVVSFHEG